MAFVSARLVFAIRKLSGARFDERITVPPRRSRPRTPISEGERTPRRKYKAPNAFGALLYEPKREQIAGLILPHQGIFRPSSGLCEIGLCAFSRSPRRVCRFLQRLNRPDFGIAVIIESKCIGRIDVLNLSIRNNTVLINRQICHSARVSTSSQNF